VKCSGTAKSMAALCSMRVAAGAGAAAEGVDVVVAPPSLHAVSVLGQPPKGYQVALQNTWTSKGGAHAGGLSAEMAQNCVRTAVLPKIPHCNSSKSVPNRPLRGRRGRFGTLLEQLECGIFGRTAVLGDDLFLWVGPCVRGACNGLGFFFVSSMNILLLWPSWPLSLTSCVSLPNVFSSGGGVPPRDRTAVVDALFSVGCGLNTPCTPDGATTHLHVAARAKERRRPSLCAWCDAPRVGPTCRRRQRVGG